jgi:7,8-dihydropterin-6-yl-methyl-4-(beta-D-ribofuranosyl)aminobenzene 5'-phosphate synthase
MKKAVRIKAQPCFTRYFPQPFHNLVMSLIRDLKITTLAENLVMTKCLGQWGLSFLLEFTDAKGDRGKLIFDTGIHKESFMYNIEQLQVDLSDVDGVVISHGHGDHTAATVEVVEAAGGVKVYAHPHTFLPRFYEDETGKRRRHGVPKGEGLEEIESAGGEIILAKEPTEVVPGVWTTGQIQRATPFERALPLSKGERLIIVVDGEEIDDHILDDQALWMDVDGVGPFVLTGCAHAGSVNTLLQVQQLGHFKEIHGLAGGTHLVGRSEEYLQQTIESLKQFGLRLISPCHCTGFKATARLWQAFPRTFVLNFAGRVIEAGKEPERRLI